MAEVDELAGELAKRAQQLAVVGHVIGSLGALLAKPVPQRERGDKRTVSLAVVVVAGAGVLLFKVTGYHFCARAGLFIWLGTCSRVSRIFGDSPGWIGNFITRVGARSSRRIDR